MSINGKEITNDADISDIVNQIAKKGIEDVIREKLSSLSSEMDKEDVEISVDLENGKAEIKGASDNLAEKINKALS